MKHVVIFLLIAILLSIIGCKKSQVNEPLLYSDKYLVPLELENKWIYKVQKSWLTEPYSIEMLVKYYYEYGSTFSVGYYMPFSGRNIWFHYFMQNTDSGLYFYDPHESAGLTSSFRVFLKYPVLNGERYKYPFPQYSEDRYIVRKVKISFNSKLYEGYSYTIETWKKDKPSFYVIPGIGITKFTLFQVNIFSREIDTTAFVEHELVDCSIKRD